MEVLIKLTPLQNSRVMLLGRIVETPENEWYVLHTDEEGTVHAFEMHHREGLEDGMNVDFVVVRGNNYAKAYVQFVK